MSLGRQLSDFRRYRDEIDRLHVKYAARSRLYDLRQDGVSLASICADRTRVARRMAEAVRTGTYRFRPARERWICRNGKRRLIYEFCPTDLIVHGVVAALLQEELAPRLREGVYSYLRGVAWWRAVADFAACVRRHRRLHPDPRARGLYVLRRDVHHYTDSIPVDERSVLWPQLQDLVRSPPDDGRFWRVIQQVVRPEIQTASGRVYQNLRGIPTGSPISTVLFNLYLREVDRALAAMPGAFYARYCDDILFAHPDAAAAREAGRRIEELLSGCRLASRPHADGDLFFNGAGRRSSSWPEALPSSAVAFLGCEVSFDGTVALHRRKVQALLRELRGRARAAISATEAGAVDDRGRSVCRTLNQALDVSSPFRAPAAALLRHVVTSRVQLRQLDYRIARLAARELTGQAGVRAFRAVPYRALRGRWGLASLFHARNRGARRM
jgi:hypothetical protein